MFLAETSIFRIPHYLVEFASNVTQGYSYLATSQLSKEFITEVVLAELRSSDLEGIANSEKLSTHEYAVQDFKRAYLLVSPMCITALSAMAIGLACISYTIKNGAGLSWHERYRRTEQLNGAIGFTCIAILGATVLSFDLFNRLNQVHTWHMKL